MANVAKDAAALCALLANENRVLILHHLMDGPMNVTQLHKRLKDITQSALSQHLSLLRANRIVECDKQGQNMVYTIIDPGAIQLMGTIRAIFPLEQRKTTAKPAGAVPAETRTGDECT
ncbi:MAG: ArsR family transcriptional regulator [Clostridia bacterium]|nr:ArsR family transcriptional regulator [Clostridia bacterium]